MRKGSIMNAKMLLGAIPLALVLSLACSSPQQAAQVEVTYYYLPG